MIVFLTLIYVAILALAVKIGVIKLSLFWKLSPLAWMLLLFLVLFLPMQWGAPSGPVNVYQYFVEVIPNVAGEVTEVPVKPLKPLKRGDVLFKIDPVPFKAKVDQLKAQLEQTIQDVAQLEESADAADSAVEKTEDEIEIKKSDLVAANSKVIVAERNVDGATAGVDRSEKLVTDLKIQVAAALREWDRRKELLVQGAGSKTESDQAEVQYTSLRSQLNTADSDLEAAIQSLAGSRAAVDSQKAETNSVELWIKQLVDADLPMAKANARQARIAANSKIGDEHTSVASVRAMLVQAEFDLNNTIVRAPSEGHVVAATLRPGQRVANFPVRSWMSFVNYEATEIVVAIKQYSIRYVKAGQDAEVTFKLRPGQIFEATVDRIAYTNTSGQLAPNGQLTVQASDFQEQEPYGVVLKLKDPNIDPALIAGGASGTAAIYTESMGATHVIRRVMIRMDAWMNYIMP